MHLIRTMHETVIFIYNGVSIRFNESVEKSCNCFVICLWTDFLCSPKQLFRVAVTDGHFAKWTIISCSIQSFPVFAHCFPSIAIHSDTINFN